MRMRGVNVFFISSRRGGERGDFGLVIENGCVFYGGCSLNKYKF